MCRLEGYHCFTYDLSISLNGYLSQTLNPALLLATTRRCPLSCPLLHSSGPEEALFLPRLDLIRHTFGVSTPMKKKILIIFGSKDEAIKMAPVIHQLIQHPERFSCQVCITGKHAHLPDPNLPLFRIKPDYDLGIVHPDQCQTSTFRSILQGTKRVLEESRPDVVLVHGETPTGLAASLAAFYQDIATGHIEAGQRPAAASIVDSVGMNNHAITSLATCHFTHTEETKQNLVKEGVASDAIFVTGNTVIDSLLAAIRFLRTDSTIQIEMARRFSYLTPNKRLILVTGNHKDNDCTGLEKICTALKIIARNARDTEIVYPVQMDATNFKSAQKLVNGTKKIHLVESSTYLPFVWLMDRCSFIISDSNSAQEKAPSLAKPVLVTKDITDRPEAITAGTAKLVGTDPDTIAGEALQLIRDRGALKRMSRYFNPFGDGLAAPRIVAYLPLALEWS
jgi:UDP-N-acetylglucosamine 2-epimerase